MLSSASRRNLHKEKRPRLTSRISKHRRAAPRISMNSKRLPPQSRRKARRVMRKMTEARRKEAPSSRSPFQEGKRPRCRKSRTSMQTKTRMSERPSFSC